MAKHIDPIIQSMTAPDPKPVPKYEPHQEDEPNANLLIWFLIVLGIVFIGIVLLRSVYNPAPPVTTVMYNEWEFTQLQDGFWQFKWQNDNAEYFIPLRYNPTQLGNVSVIGTLSPSFGSRRNVYIAVDPSTEKDQAYVALGVGEIGLNLIKVFSVNLIPSCTRNETLSCTTRPIVNCQSVNKSVIIIREGPGPIVNQTGDCIVVQGKQLELLQAVDRLLYKFYKVIIDAPQQ